jgi:hypothetical protein
MFMSPWSAVTTTQVESLLFVASSVVSRRPTIESYSAIIA